jgi:hypothetical protein
VPGPYQQAGQACAYPSATHNDNVHRETQPSTVAIVVRQQRAAPALLGSARGPLRAMSVDDTPRPDTARA